MEPIDKRKKRSKGKMYIPQWSVNNCVKNKVLE